MILSYYSTASIAIMAIHVRWLRQDSKVRSFIVAQSVELRLFRLPHYSGANPIFSAAGKSRRIQMMRMAILKSASRSSMMQSLWMSGFSGYFLSITSRHCRQRLGLKPCSKSRDIMVLWNCDTSGLRSHAFHTRYVDLDVGHYPLRYILLFAC